MRSLDHLPLLNPPLDPPPAAGTSFRDRRGFTYEVLEVKPHINKDDTLSALLTLRGQCCDCGELFVFKQGPRAKGLPRRCPSDAKGKGRETTWPYGTAPAVAPASHAETVTMVRKAIDRAVMAQMESATPAEKPVINRVVLAIWRVLSAMETAPDDETDADDDAADDDEG